MRISREKPILLALTVVGAVSGCWWAIQDVSILTFNSYLSLLHRYAVPSLEVTWTRRLTLESSWLVKASLVTLIARSQRRITDIDDLDDIVEQIIDQEGEEAVFRSLLLLKRKGSRPEVRGIIPQRQVDHGSRMLTDEVNTYMVSLASNYPTLLRIAPSVWEGGHVDALFLLQSPTASASSSSLSSRMLANVAPRLEIAHVHSTDGSLHISLSPADAAEIIRKGWGVRHRLAGHLGVPNTYILVYSPRNADEAAVVKKMIAATVEYATGGIA